MSEHSFSPSGELPDIATEQAAQLLGNAMRDTEAPVMEMAGALARITSMLSKAQGMREAARACENGCSELIQDDIAICIQSLQFHDRLIQQLTAVRRLMGSAALPGEMSARGFMPAEGSVELF